METGWNIFLPPYGTKKAIKRNSNIFAGNRVGIFGRIRRVVQGCADSVRQLDGGFQNYILPERGQRMNNLREQSALVFFRLRYMCKKIGHGTLKNSGKDAQTSKFGRCQTLLNP